MKRLGLSIALAMALVSTAQAQDYPNRAINIIVPFAAGGPTDTVGRLLGQAMGKTLGQTMVVENIGGAGGTLGAAKAAAAKNDGYVIFLHHIGHSTAATLYRKLPYDTLNDFEPIGQVVDVPMTLVSKPDFAPKDFEALVAHAKEQKTKVTYGNAGIGSASHLCGMLFMSAIQTEL